MAGRPSLSTQRVPLLGTTPTENPPSGAVLLYFKSDGRLYTKSSTGLERAAASEPYVQSRGTNLVTNGSGLIGDNTNFSICTFTPADAPTGSSGAFAFPAGQATRYMDEFIPVDPSKIYEVNFDYRQTAGVGRFYFFFAPYDAYGLSIAPSHYMAQTGTQTTLAAPLNPGDTTITLTSAAGWHNAAGSSTWLRSIIFWDYVDPGGKAWPVNTYSRNFHTDLWADGGISGNVITLRVPWTGPAKAAGTLLSNGSSGGALMYIAATNTVAQNIWTHYVGRTVSGAHLGGTSSAATTKFPIATAKAKVGFLVNYPDGTLDPASRQSVANLTVDEVTIAATVETALALKAPLASPAFTGTPTGITKAHVGLANVDNTSDANKPVSTATQAALDALVPAVPDRQVFTISGTWTKPAGARYVVVQVQGAGGGAGGAGASPPACGVGGSGGGYAERLIDAASLGSTETVTVGTGGGGGGGANSGNAGGNSSFGTWATGNGGAGGGIISANQNAAITGSAPGGGTATGGIVVDGERAEDAWTGGAAVANAGAGGNSVLGHGGVGRHRQVSASVGGDNGGGYGSGGGGALNTGGGNAIGGAGAPGIVIVTTYF